MDLSSFIHQTIRTTIDADGITIKGDITKELKIISDANFHGDDNVILSFELGPRSGNFRLLNSTQWLHRNFGGLVSRSVRDTSDTITIWCFNWNKTLKEEVAEWIRARLSEAALC